MIEPLVTFGSLQWARCMLQVSKYRSMNVSTMTDARVHSNYVIQTGEVPVRHTHEEYMDVSPPASCRAGQLCRWLQCSGA